MVFKQENYQNALADYNKNKYLYNGKELQDDQLAGRSLNWYDYGARMYDAALARFHTLDPLAESFNYQSPFVYAANNPIVFIDYNGEGPIAFGFIEIRVQIPVLEVLGIAASVNATAYMDLESGELGLSYGNYSFGLGAGGGLALSGGGGLSFAQNLDELEGWGANIGLAMSEGYNIGGYEWNWSFYDGLTNLHKASRKGGNFSPPGAGIGGIMAFCAELSHTSKILRFGTISEVVDHVFEEYNKKLKEYIGTNEWFMISQVFDLDYDMITLEYFISKDEVREHIEKLLSGQNGTTDNESEKKKEKSKKFFNNFSNLQEGTYTWDGNDWVLE